jgi:SAM-dependent methyltransferase
VGCGPGGLVESFDNASEYRGFDASPEYVAEANAKFAGRGTFEVARVNDGLNWPTDGPFDHVIGVGLLHHMADVDVRWFFREALRVLRPGGVAVTIDPVFHDGQNPVARRLAAADRGEFVRQFEEYQLLASSHAEHVDALVLTDMLRIPYSHCVMRVTAS